MLTNEKEHMSLQPIVTLLAAFIGAWLANLNFNKQKVMEQDNIKENLNEEIKDIRDEMVRIIPKLIKSYDSVKLGVVGKIEDISVPRKTEILIISKALDSIYSKISPERRMTIKSIIKIVGFLGEKHEIISSKIMGEKFLKNSSERDEIIDLASNYKAYIISSSVLYYYCNGLCEASGEFKLNDNSNDEIVNKVMESLSLDFSIY